ncbi:MAG: hypothetical protein ACK53Q_06330 [Dolichospermum sp.]|jgi:hypothetical protein
MQDNSNTVEKGKSLPLDRGEIVTIPRLELDALINRAAASAAEKAVSKAVKQFEILFLKPVGEKAWKGEKWLNTATAAMVLGKKPETLRKMVRKGTLRLNIEVRDDRPKSATKPVYIFDIAKCEERLLTPPEKRGNK